MKKLLPMFFCLILLLVPGCGTAGQGERESLTVYAMDTVMTLTAYAPEEEPECAAQGLSMAESEIYKLESLLSVSREGSDIYNLNQNKSATISEGTGQLLLRAIELSEVTGGAFDPTVYPLMELWGFTGDTQQVPKDTEIAQTLPCVGTKHVLEVSQLDGYGACYGEISENCGLDLGGIAKGYAAEQVLEIMEDAGIETAVISLGGNVGLLGTKPDGSPWTVAVEKPDGSGETAATLSIPGGEKTYCVTSGAYQRYFQENGVTYHHILDPQTGYPAETDLLSVTIVSKNGTQADALSTALFVMGFDDAVAFWQSGKYDFDLVLMTAEGIFASPGLSIAADTPITILEETP